MTSKHKCIKHPHDRALIAFGSDVLEILQRHAEVLSKFRYSSWSPDTAAEIADSARNFGLVDNYDDTDGFVASRRDCFENPLNL